MQNLLKKFDKYAAFRAFVGKKSERALGEFLDLCGLDNICKYIELGVLVTDKIPMQNKMAWRASLEPFKDTFHIFTDQDLYNWIPKKYREFFEKKYGQVYAEYMVKQTKAIRDFLTY